MEWGGQEREMRTSGEDRRGRWKPEGGGQERELKVE